ncbi:MAG: hypothetical protein ACTTK1_05520 [Candidatus Cryptobacteroides sp.]
MSFLDYLLSGSNNPPAGEFIFASDDHVRYQNGQNVSGHNTGCHRSVKIEKNISGGEGYSVTIYNDDSVHPLWGNNVQMSTKRMRVSKKSSSCIELVGYGTDSFGCSFSDYGLSVHLQDGRVYKCVLHMFDRNVDIEYLTSSIASAPQKEDIGMFGRKISHGTSKIELEKQIKCLTTLEEATLTAPLDNVRQQKMINIFRLVKSVLALHYETAYEYGQVRDIITRFEDFKVVGETTASFTQLDNAGKKYVVVDMIESWQSCAQFVSILTMINPQVQSCSSAIQGLEKTLIEIKNAY